jgi:hypothetical protein
MDYDIWSGSDLFVLIDDENTHLLDPSVELPSLEDTRGILLLLVVLSAPVDLLVSPFSAKMVLLGLRDDCILVKICVNTYALVILQNFPV